MKATINGKKYNLTELPQEIITKLAKFGMEEKAKEYFMRYIPTEAERVKKTDELFRRMKEGYWNEIV